MAEPKSDPLSHLLPADEESKASKRFEKAKIDKEHHHHRETHGKRNDIDENTSVDEIRAPNVFERVKEEIEALVQTIHPKKESPIYERRDEVVVKESKETIPEPQTEIRAIMRQDKSPIRHHQETHGRSSSIDEKTSINEVKGPNIFERAKEEIEALVHTIHHKQETDSPKKEGLGSKIGRGLEKVCAPHKAKNDKSQNCT